MPTKIIQTKGKATCIRLTDEQEDKIKQIMEQADCNKTTAIGLCIDNYTIQERKNLSLRSVNIKRDN